MGGSVTMRKMLFAGVAGAVLLLAALLASQWWQAQMRPRPPRLEVRSEGAAIPVRLGAFCWETQLARACTDATSGRALLKSGQYTTVALRQFAVLEMRFAAAPREMTISYWVGDRKFSDSLGRVTQVETRP